MSKFFFYVALIQTLFATLASAGNGFGQRLDHTRISTSWKNTPLVEAFGDVQAQTDLFFTYTYETIQSVRINNQDQELSVADLLKYISGETGLRFRIIDDIVYVFNGEFVPGGRVQLQIPQKEAITALLETMEHSVIYEVGQPELYPNKIIRGQVLSTDGDPLIGATVQIKESGLGTITDVDGSFQLSIPDDEETVLVVSYIGYRTREVLVNRQGMISVQLEEIISELNEVVVVGYGTQKKENLSGAVSQVSGDVLASRPITNVASGLQGVAPNLNVTFNSGNATQAPDFNIRGFESINGGSPLIIVDGVPIDGAELARLNPADIAKVSVLKDASASAIYGARAAFGVVLITTKTGDSEDLRVNYNTFYGIRELTAQPKIVTDPLTVMQIKDVMAAPWYDLYNEKDFAYGETLQDDPSAPHVIVNPDNPDSWKYYGATDWFKEVYRDFGENFSHNLSFSRKLDKVAYFLSGEYAKTDGLLKYGNDTFDKYNLRAKVDLELTDRITLSNNTAYTNSRYDAPQSLNYGGNTYSDWLFFHNINRQNSLSVPKNPDGTWTSNGASMLGSLQDGGRTDTRNNEFQTTFRMNLELIENHLDLTGDATFRRGNLTRAQHYLPIPYRSGPEMPMQTSGNSSARRASEETRYNVYNIYAKYQQDLGDHHLEALAGFNQEEKIFEGFSAGRDQLISSGLPSIQLSTGEDYVGAYEWDWAVQGLFYRLNYIYKGKYILETNGRYDGSSRFPTKDRFGFFPSASAAWILSEEPFFRNIPKNPVSFVKLRASYGTLGNQLVSDHYPYIPNMSASPISTLLQGERPIGVSAPPLVSGSLTWEEVTTLNFGLDLGFFDDRVTLGLDIYQRDTENMLSAGRTLPGVLGTSVPLENAADLRTKGWELSLGWQDKTGSGTNTFTYDIDLFVYDSEATITRFDNPEGYLGDYYNGYQIGTIWGLETLGFFSSAEDVAAHADQTQVASYPGTRPIEAGDLKFADRNGDGAVNWGTWTLDDHGDYFIIGNSAPRYQFGATVNLSWKGFDLRTFLQGVGKRDYYPGAGSHYFWGIFAQPWSNVLERNLDYWTPDNPNAYFPRLKSYTAETGRELGIAQTKYLQNAAYLRMKNLTLGYTFPQSAFSGIGLSKLRMYVSGENLLTVTALPKDLDPEVLDGRAYPLQRTFAVGLSAAF